MDIVISYVLAIGALVWSYSQDKAKTRQGLKKAWEILEKRVFGFYG